MLPQSPFIEHGKNQYSPLWTDDEQVGSNPPGRKTRFSLKCASRFALPPEEATVFRTAGRAKRAFGLVPNAREFLAEHYVYVFENQSADFLVSRKVFEKSEVGTKVEPAVQVA